MKKLALSEHFAKIMHKFSRFTKQQKVFVLYLVALIFFLLVLPIMRIAPVNDDSHGVWLLNFHMFKTVVIIAASLAVLVAWNVSFRFKNFVISYFGFKENDSLVNFGFLWIIATAFFAMGDNHL